MLLTKFQVKLGFAIETVLAIFDLQIILMLPTKFALPHDSNLYLIEG